jgi:hypothetical protein
MAAIAYYTSYTNIQQVEQLLKNFSFRVATLDLNEKAGFRPLFQKIVVRLTRTKGS